MKTFYTIADTHGLLLSHFDLDIRGLAADKNNVIIFTGDYCDSFNFTDDQHIQALTEIIQLKKDNPDNVILLLGNHDIAYWYNKKPYIQISGFRYSYSIQMHELFKENAEHFQLAYQYGNYLWTHAGVQNYWFKNIFEASKEEKEEVKETGEIAELLNRHFAINNESLFVVGQMRGGWNRVGGPTWCDKDELYNSPIAGYVQIIGHTPHRGSLPVTYQSYNEQTYICCDVYGYMLDKYEKEKKRLQMLILMDKYNNITEAIDNIKIDYSKFKIPETAIYKVTI